MLFLSTCAAGRKTYMSFPSQWWTRFQLWRESVKEGHSEKWHFGWNDEMSWMLNSHFPLLIVLCQKTVPVPETETPGQRSLGQGLSLWKRRITLVANESDSKRMWPSFVKEKHINMLLSPLSPLSCTLLLLLSTLCLHQSYHDVNMYIWVGKTSRGEAQQSSSPSLLFFCSFVLLSKMHIEPTYQANLTSRSLVYKSWGKWTLDFLLHWEQ